MAKRRAARRGRASAHLTPTWWIEALGLLLILMAGLGALALATYDPSDPIFRFTEVRNAAGVVGASSASLLFRSLGFGAAVAVGVALTLGARLLLDRPLPAARFWWGAVALATGLAALPPLLHHVWPDAIAAHQGGWLGARVSNILRVLVSVWGGLLVASFAAIVGGLAICGVGPGVAVALILKTIRLVALQVTALVTAIASFALRIALALAATAALFWRELTALPARIGGAISRARQDVLVRRARRERRTQNQEAAEIAAPAAEESGAVQIARSDASVAEAALPGQPATAKSGKAARGEPSIVDHRQEKAREPEQERFAFREGTTLKDYEAPDIGIFGRAPEASRSFDRDSLIMNSRILEKKLGDFGVSGRVVTVHPGPVVTMYEFEPASGIKVGRITSLGDDLALALRALSVRIIAPLPGKSVVGIEIPNPERDVVYLRDLLEAESFRNTKASLPFALGKDIFGNPVEADLTKMPHLLVAGATGTGKSVFLNAVLCSILFRTAPDELRLLMIDPKILELSIYEGIPHLIADVVTNPKRAAAALAGVVHKMEDRYQMMAALGVRNIAQFNTRVDEMLADGLDRFALKPKPGESEGEERPLERLPYIVVVIDELADLMVVSARDVEESLQRLAQMARASGIHLVLATQRPSVDVLTGVIKANFPSRISFQVSSRTDSRTILDQNGAEHLLGQGDMLFLPPGTSKVQRIHGAFVSEKEVAELVTHLRAQGSPHFDETLIRAREESEAKEQRGDDVDDLYDRALSIVAESRNASISYLQRRLKVGYNRAARMVEQMEEEGVVGPQDGTKPREIYAQPIAE